jgi:DNA (cytosine-5)-methyltransferase 1
MAPEKLTVLSAFSGLGGLDLGLEKAGFQSIGCIEIDETARRSLIANRPHWRLIKPHDIIEAAETLTPRKLGIRKRELTLLAGGPPCQPFSKAAQWSHRAMRGMRDPRSKCLAGFIQLIESFLPSVVLIENVQGFISGRANAVQRIKNGLRLINKTHKTQYRLQHWTINAADYGIPQRRTRAILCATRDGAELQLPVATHRDDPINVWEAIRHLSAKQADRPKLSHWAKLLPSIPEGYNYLWHTPRGGGSPLFGYRTRYWSFLLKLSKSQPSWTISAQPGPYTGPFHWENRPLSTVELLRIQSFPASWKVLGSRSDQVRQIGNATPPLLAEILGRAISKHLLGIHEKSPPSLAIQHSKVAPPAPAKIKRIPSLFKRHIKWLPDHPGTGRGPSPTKPRSRLVTQKKNRQRSLLAA